MNSSYSSVSSKPITLQSSTESQVYLLFALAMGLTVVGFFVGTMYAPVLYSAGLHIVLLIVQLGLIFTAPMWMEKSPLNYLLFGTFPILSGVAIAPYIAGVLLTYQNGPVIVLNAMSATVFMALAAAVFARTTSWNLGVLSRGLFFALLGLIGFGILQFFVPAFQTSQFDMILSGVGIVVFAAFTAYDLQRIEQLGKAGANPFMLALSLYLDIFNLFLYVLRFMLVLYGDRR